MERETRVRLLIGAAMVIMAALAGAAYIWPDSFAGGAFPGIATSR